MWKPLVRKFTRRTDTSNTRTDDARRAQFNPLTANTRATRTVHAQATPTNVAHYAGQLSNQRLQLPDHLLEHQSDYLPDDVPDHLIPHVFDASSQRMPEHVSEHVSDYLSDDIPAHLIEHLFDAPTDVLTSHLPAGDASKQSPEDFILQAQQILMSRIEHQLALIDQRVADRLSPDVGWARFEDKREYEYKSAMVLEQYGTDNAKLLQRHKKIRDNIEMRNDVDKHEELNALHDNLLLTLERAFVHANAQLDRLDPPPDYDKVLANVQHSS